MSSESPGATAPPNWERIVKIQRTTIYVLFALLGLAVGMLCTRWQFNNQLGKPTLPTGPLLARGCVLLLKPSPRDPQFAKGHHYYIDFECPQAQGRPLMTLYIDPDKSLSTLTPGQIVNFRNGELRMAAEMDKLTAK